MNHSFQHKTPVKIRDKNNSLGKRKDSVYTIKSFFRISERVFMIEKKSKSEIIKCIVCKGTELLPESHYSYKRLKKTLPKEVCAVKCPFCEKGKQRETKYYWEVVNQQLVIDHISSIIRNNGIEVSYNIGNIAKERTPFYHTVKCENIFLTEELAMEEVEKRNNSPHIKWDTRISRF
ncbi:MAG: hypothetical protein M0P71_00710 [Melioribacteraceae bacterium]|nr:hypothetical protein [Melioribacteraceae bacterium]